MNSEEIAFYTEKAKLTESQIEALRKEISAFREQTARGDVSLEETPELVKLQTENSKLKHRIAILRRAIANEESKDNSVKKLPSPQMASILNELRSLFGQAVKIAFPDIDVPIVITLSKSATFGDYQFNSSLQISHILKGKGVPTPPRQVADKILPYIPESDLVQKLDVAGPGYINVHLGRAHTVKVLMSVFKNGVQPPPLKKRLRVVVDFSSPNIAKQMHVGHLRSTIIGDSICRLLEFLGHDVLRLNHVGDWGTQFGMLIAHLQDEFPNYLEQSPPIADLQTFYRESKKLFDSDEEFKKRAYACVVKLQNGDPDYLKAWQLICDVSRREFQKVYDRLDINVNERGESFYQSRMEKIVQDLENGGFLEEDEGRKIMWGNSDRKETDLLSVPLTIVKSDGGYTYDTSDMAAIKQRIEEEKADWLIYVTDDGQASHFKTIVQCATRAGIFDPARHRLDHVGFGVVLDTENKKFKTRSGETIKLVDLLDEGIRRAQSKLKERNRDTALTLKELKEAEESIAYGCIKYADLSRNRNLAYVFSFDKMLEDRGNTAVYLLYAYTRIRSIARTANLSEEDLRKSADSNPITVDHDKEFKLAKVLLRFPDVLLKITEDLYLNHLCEFVYEVSTAFSEFYDSCYCIEKNNSDEIVNVHIGRIILCEVTAMFMAKCFDILGLKPVSKM